jgi:hypothetical protein
MGGEGLPSLGLINDIYAKPPNVVVANACTTISLSSKILRMYGSSEYPNF